LRGDKKETISYFWVGLPPRATVRGQTACLWGRGIKIPWRGTGEKGPKMPCAKVPFGRILQRELIDIEGNT